MESKSSGINLLFGDIREKIKCVPDESVSLIYWDAPYGKNRKDTKGSFVPVPELMDEINRVAKPNCRIIVQSRCPDSVHFMNELEEYYDTIWYSERVHHTSIAHGKKKPASAIDEILIFTIKPDKNSEPAYHFAKTYETIHEFDTYRSKVPSNFIPANKATAYKTTLIQSQRAVDILEYFLQVYSSPGDVVLDLFMGSASMALACMNTKRVYYGAELEENIFYLAANRISEYMQGKEFKFKKSNRKGKKIINPD